MVVSRFSIISRASFAIIAMMSSVSSAARTIGIGIGFRVLPS
jgi:hypothetical protein